MTEHDQSSTATTCRDCAAPLRREHGAYEFEDGTVTSTFILVCRGECRRRYLPEQVFGAGKNGSKETDR